MLYASEVQQALQAYPDRRFKVSELVRYSAGRHLDKVQYEAARKAVRRVLLDLAEMGCVTMTCTAPNSCTYQWVARA